MKKTQGYAIHKLIDETLLVPCDERCERENAVITLSETAAFLYEMSDRVETEEELAHLLAKAYEISVDEVREDVKETLRLFRDRGLVC